MPRRDTFSEWPIIETPHMKVGQILALERECTLMMHPLTALRTLYPMSPVWCERTLGHQEMRRDQRRQKKR
jgi:hypothetical protein